MTLLGRGASPATRSLTLCASNGHFSIGHCLLLARCPYYPVLPLPPHAAPATLSCRCHHTLFMLPADNALATLHCPCHTTLPLRYYAGPATAYTTANNTFATSCGQRTRLVASCKPRNRDQLIPAFSLPAAWPQHEYQAAALSLCMWQRHLQNALCVAGDSWRTRAAGGQLDVQPGAWQVGRGRDED